MELRGADLGRFVEVATWDLFLSEEIKLGSPVVPSVMYGRRHRVVPAKSLLPTMLEQDLCLHNQRGKPTENVKGLGYV